MRKQKTIGRAGILLIFLVVLAGVICARCCVAGDDLQDEPIPDIPAETVAHSPNPASEQVTVKLENAAIPTPAPVSAPPKEEADQVNAVEEKPARVARYAYIDISDEEMEELAAIVYLEAGNQCFEGQQAVAEVVLNRVVNYAFPNTVSEVLHQGEHTDVPQFSTIYHLGAAEVTQTQYDAINAALYGDSILPLDVVFFSRAGENDRVWGKIGDHVFCYEYVWG